MAAPGSVPIVPGWSDGVFLFFSRTPGIVLFSRSRKVPDWITPSHIVEPYREYEFRCESKNNCLEDMSISYIA